MCERWDALARHLTHLDCDDDRTPQPDPDTVTLRREDARAMYESAVVPLDEDRRIRAALGWGDSDDA